uniref:DUF4371 domain-containing protein n=1 Tax=Amphimedon queenslandica TaxID=400682 RepID=A0A1X7VI14_AMPQE
MHSVEKPQENIDTRLNSQRIHNKEENRHIVKCSAESILLCGRQCIALRRDKELLHLSMNPDFNNNVREEFLLYSLLTSVTGEAIASGVLRNLAELGLGVKSVRGQVYDGASISQVSILDYKL